MASFLADGLVTELPRPSLVAVALERPIAVAVLASGKRRADGAVVASPADVTPEQKRGLDARCRGLLRV